MAYPTDQQFSQHSRINTQKNCNYILRRCLYAITNQRINVRSSRTVPSKIKKQKHESSFRQITLFLDTRKISWTHYREKHYNSIEITHRCNTKTPDTHKKKKIQELLGMLNFLSKYEHKMQLHLRPLYNILRQQNHFEWTTEHQTRFEEIKKLLTEQISITNPDPTQPIYAMCDASIFGIGAALLQSHNGTKKMNLISANSRIFTHAELRLSSLMRECTAITYTLTEYEFLIPNSFIYRSLTYFILFCTKVKSKP